MPQPIETAPKDGTVILTEYGFMKFLSFDDLRYCCWVICDCNGVAFVSRRDDHFEEFPQFWEPLPEWVLTPHGR